VLLCVVCLLGPHELLWQTFRKICDRCHQSSMVIHKSLIPTTHTDNYSDFSDILRCWKIQNGRNFFEGLVLDRSHPKYSQRNVISDLQNRDLSRLILRFAFNNFSATTFKYCRCKSKSSVISHRDNKTRRAPSRNPAFCPSRE
jgi:hypothetical protein